MITTSNGKTNGFHAPVRGVKTLLKRLAALWLPHAQKGLEVRMEMGGMLNEKLGAPVERLPHGEAVLKQVAKRLRISESELSRMRWFAHLFGSVKVLQRRHPRVTSWANVKGMLPNLIAKAKGRKLSAGRDPNAAIIGGLCKSLDHLISKLGESRMRLDEEERQDLIERLRKLGKAAQRRLKVHVSVKA